MHPFPEQVTWELNVALSTNLAHEVAVDGAYDVSRLLVLYSRLQDTSPNPLQGGPFDEPANWLKLLYPWLQFPVYSWKLAPEIFAKKRPEEHTAL